MILWMNVIASGMFLSVLEGKRSSQQTRDINRAFKVPGASLEFGSLLQEAKGLLYSVT